MFWVAAAGMWNEAKVAAQQAADRAQSARSN